MSARTSIRLKLFVCLLVVAASSGAWQWLGKEPNTLRVWFADVGQGAAVIIRTPSKDTIVIDGGPSRSFIQQVDKHLPFTDRNIDLVVATHADADHVSGLVPLLESGRVRAILINRIGKDTAAYKQLLAAIDKQKIPTIEARTGQRFAFGEATFDVLWPDPEILPNIVGKKIDYNSQSIVTHLAYGSEDFLFTGDAPAKIESALLAASALKPMEVLQVAHHGSKASTSEPFLQAIHPQLAIIQVGVGNRYGHPTLEILQRLQQFGAQIWRNDEVGTILVEGDKNSLKVTPD